MPLFVTLTYDPSEQRTTVEMAGCEPYTAPEPDGILGLCSTGCLLSRCGSTVSYRIRRPRAADVRDAR